MHLLVLMCTSGVSSWPHILFILYINGVTKIKLSDNSFLTLFADDMSLTKIIQTDDDILELQADH